MERAEVQDGNENELERQLLLLVEASSRLLASPESHDVLDTLLALGQKLIQADAYAAWWKQAGGGWDIVTMSGLSSAYGRTVLAAHVPGGLLGIEPVAVEDTLSSESLAQRREQYQAEGIRSLLIIPVHLRATATGTIVFYYRTPHHFLDSEKRIGVALASLATAALTTAELHAEQKRVREEAERSTQRATFLSEAGEVISSSLDYEETLKSIADRAVPFFADWCGVDVLDGTEIRRVAIKHLDPRKLDVLALLAERFPPEEDDAIRVALRTGDSLLMEEIPDELIAERAKSKEHAALIRQLELKSLIIAPMVVRGRSLGCLSFATAESGRKYSPGDLELAEEIARRAAIAIENARLYRQVVASEQQWQTLANSIPQLAWMADETGWLFWYNQRWYDYTGTTFDEMQGWGWKKVHHPDHVERVVESVSRAWETGEPWEDTFPLRSKEGEWRWFLSRALPIRNDSGRVVRWFGTNTDVTELRETREALESSRADLASRLSEFETLLEVTPVGLIIAYDRECRQIRINRAFAEWVGVDSAVNISRTGPNAGRLPYGVFKDGQELEGSELPMQTAAREARQVEAEVDLVRDDGRVIRVFGYATPLFDERGQVRGSVGAFVDVTERRRAEEERQQLLSLEQEARSTAELLNRLGPLLLTELDLKRLVQSVTDMATELTGAEFGSFFYNVVNEKGETYSLYTLSGAPREAFEKFPMPRNTAVFGPTFRGEGVVRSDDITKDPRYGHNAPYYGMPKGHLPVCSYLAVPVISRSGDVLGGLFFGHSKPARFTARHEAIVTGIAAQAAIAIDNAKLFEETRRTQRELQSANEELMRVNRDLEQFAYSASHDLKEPLRNVAIYSEMIARKYGSGLDGQAQDFLACVVQNAKRMDSLVNDLLVFTQAGSEIKEGEDKTASAAAALEITTANLSSTIAELEATITHDALPDVRMRKVHLEQLFQNLLGNALKYKSSARPRIHVTARRDKEHWIFSVRDNGIGIEPEYQERIFGIFKRLHTATQYPGTGIGLAICKRIVERYHGRIWVESEPGRGATFFFTVPV